MSKTPITLTPKSHLPPPPRPSCSSTACDEDALRREHSPCAALRLSGFTGRRHNGRRVKRCTPAWLCVSFVVLSKHQCCHVEGAARSVFNIFHYKQMKSGTGWLMDSASPLWCWVSALHFPWTLPFPPALYLLQKTKFFSSCAKKTCVLRLCDKVPLQTVEDVGDFSCVLTCSRVMQDISKVTQETLIVNLLLLAPVTCISLFWTALRSFLTPWTDFQVRYGGSVHPYFYPPFKPAFLWLVATEQTGLWT